jgi:hypothetical protein
LPILMRIVHLCGEEQPRERFSIRRQQICWSLIFNEIFFDSIHTRSKHDSFKVSLFFFVDITHQICQDVLDPEG